MLVDNIIDIPRLIGLYLNKHIISITIVITNTIVLITINPSVYQNSFRIQWVHFSVFYIPYPAFYTQFVGGDVRVIL